VLCRHNFRSIKMLEKFLGNVQSKAHGAQEPECTSST
jgi:hypothetical protein